MTDSFATGAPDAGPLGRPTAEGYYARVRGLLLSPVAEWTKIALEKPSLRQLLLFWVLPFTAIFFLAPQLGAIAFPEHINGKPVAPSLVGALYTVIVGTAFMAGGVWALAWIADYLAPTFGGRRDADQALKLAAYSGTGLWLSGLVGFAPPLILLGAVGIVWIYTLYRGLPVLMHAPEDKTLPYAAAIVGAAIVMMVVLISLSSCMSMFAGPAPAPRPVAAVAPAKARASAPVPAGSGAIDPEKMRRLIPEAIPGGWVRAGISQNAGGALGVTGPTVEAVFERGGQRIVVRVIDAGAGAANAIAALRATQPAQDDPRALIVHGESEGRYTFAKTDRVSGVERWLTLVGGRIAIYAEGQGGVTQGQIQEALGLIDMVRVAQIARGM